jgi:methylthioribulose-1-phosphate dehydratase
VSQVAPLSPETLAIRETLAALGARYHRAGWNFGTSGNLSARVTIEGASPAEADRVVVTASGRDKSQLGEDDFVEVSLEGELLAAGPRSRPSAETSIHLAVYRTRPDARVSLHVHTVASTLASPDKPAAGDHDHPRLVFTGLELIKGWDLWEQGEKAELPLFPNHHRVPQIASDIEAFYRARPDERVPSLLIASHGITAWGADAFSANRHLEVTEFLCQVALARRSVPTAPR